MNITSQKEKYSDCLYELDFGGGGGDHMVFRWSERSGDPSSLKGYGGTMEN